MSKQTVTVVGLGYVGLPLALLVEAKGYNVFGIDYDLKKVNAINKGKSTFVDKEVTKQLKSSSLKAQNNYAGVEDAQIVIVCVPTPLDHAYLPDLKPVISACSEIAKRLTKGQLIIIESTINPGVCEDVILPILESVSGKKCGKDFYLAHCPERINPGDPKWNVANIARVVGGYDKKSLQLAASFYRSIITGEVKEMGSLKEAEAVKVVENSFRDVNIAFVNELAMSFSKLGIDIVNVIDGAATKPFAFMAHYPGAGVGGHCIPIDPHYLIEYAKQNGFKHKFLSVARDINNGMPNFVVDQLKDVMAKSKRSINDTKVTVLGLSYKADVGDIRESPSLEIIKILKKQKFQVAAYDPYVEKHDLAPQAHADLDATYDDKLQASIKGADAVIVATAHKEFINLDPETLRDAGVSIVIDGRNRLDKEAIESAGMVYRGIGR